MGKQEIYVSVDIESDGPIPGENSMLSFGAAAYTNKKELIGTFERNLKCLDGARQNKDTMEWWKTQSDAWKYCRENQQDPSTAIVEFAQWLKGLDGKPVCVCYPAGFDFTFIYWYLMKFNESSPFGFQALDIKSYAMAKLGFGFKETSKRKMPKRWFDDLPHTHKSLDDAIEQGAMFINILNDIRA